jgi:hypothetical protein
MKKILGRSMSRGFGEVLDQSSPGIVGVPGLFESVDSDVLEILKTGNA